MRKITAVFALFWFLIAPPPAVTAQADLREQFSTDNIAAANHIQRGIQLAQNNQHKNAVGAFQQAIKLDPKCGMAYFQLALAQGDLGDIQEAIVSYQAVLADDSLAARNIRATAATNLGLIHAQLEKLDEATHWFSRAILEDYDNRFGQRGKAYRNLSLSLRTLKRPLSAAIAVAMAFEDKAKNCDANMVREYFRDLDNAEGARVLRVEEPAVAVKPRGALPVIEEVTPDTNATETIREMHPDPLGRFVVAIPAKGDHYYVIQTGEKIEVKKVEAAPILAACLVDGQMYVSRANPDRFERIDIPAGKVLQSFPIGKPAPLSLAACPAHDRIFFPSGGIVHQFEMTSGRVRETNSPGQVVCVDPAQRFVYSYSRPERPGMASANFVAIEGKLYAVKRGVDWIQTTLFKSIVTPGGLLIAEVRDNAASNGNRLVLSQDGHWVGVVGAGGYRPAKMGDKGGYGVALFDAHNLEKMHGFYPADAYPQGCSINPVSGTVATVRAEDFRLHHLTDSEHGQVTTGKWTGVSTWSGDGRLILLATAGGGFRAFRLTRTEAETESAGTWHAAIKPARLIGKEKVSTNAVGPIAAFQKFAVPDQLDASMLRKQVEGGIAGGRTARLPQWATHPNYSKEQGAIQEVTNAIQALQTGSGERTGIALFRLKEANVKTPNYAPVQFFLAELQLRKGDTEESLKNFLAAIRGDAGQTDISHLALEGLSHHYAVAGNDLKAAYCLAGFLETDKANVRNLRKLADALKKVKLDTEAEAVLKLVAGAPPTEAPLRGLLPLAAPPVNRPKLSGEDLYTLAAPSVVVIKSTSGTGSGVCISRDDLVITNAHVVDRDGEVEVRLFEWKEKNLVLRSTVRGRVLLRSEANDLAVVQLPKNAAKLKPLPVAMDAPKGGAKVYALGSPGLGGDVLEQSISEGIVSAPERKLDGKTYLQTTNSVNPGNSGGPLLDDTGCLIGLVTLKAKLDGVSFALPAATIRSLFPKDSK